MCNSKQFYLEQRVNIQKEEFIEFNCKYNKKLLGAKKYN